MKLVVIPVAFLSAAVVIIYFYLYSKQQESQIANHHVMLSSLFADAYDLEHSFSKPQLDRLANSVLSINGHRSIALITPENTVAAEYGLPWQHLIDAQQLTGSVYMQRDLLVYILRPGNKNGPTANNPAQVAKIAVVTENFHNKLNNHRAITGVILATTICFFILLYFARQFDLALTMPLSKIQNGLRELIKGKLNSPIIIKKNTIYAELTALINTFISTQKSEQDDLQESIDQATQDLRESLESVEIQNIELDFARKNAVQANRAKSEFLANTSHEIKVPVGGIISSTDLLARSKLTKQQSNYVRSIQDSATELNNTINDILDYSRLEVGTLTLEHKPVSVRKIVEECVQALASSAADKNILLLSIVDHEVPDNLLGDPQRIKQILFNLTSNAIKYTPEGYVLISITNDLISEDKYSLRFKVTDSGIGLSESQQDSLFDQFTQLDSMHNRPRGTSGLGLIIAKGLVDRMNGQIGVESQKDRGATFWFTASFSKNLAIKNLQASRKNSLSQVTVVILQNNTMNKMESLHYFRGWGAKTVEANDAEKLLEFSGSTEKSGQHCLFLIDLQALSASLKTTKIKEFVSNLATPENNYCCLLYNFQEDRLFSESEDKLEKIIQIEKPALYQSLYQSICKRLDIRYDVFDTEQQATSSTEAKEIVVLAVDDNPANLKLLTQLLTDNGIQIDTAPDGETAISKFSEGNYDLIFMDVHMPELNGIETTVKIREIENGKSRVPIIALTAHAENDKKMSLLISGMDDYLSKPIDEHSLQKVLNRWAYDTQLTSTSENELDLEYFYIDPASTSRSAPMPVDIALSLRRAQNKPDLAKDMLVMLINSLNDSKENINKYKLAGDTPALQEVVHKLHGGSCYCGIPRFTEVCATLDSDLQKGDTSNLNTNLLLLFKQIDELLSWASQTDLNVLFEDDAQAG